MLLTRLIPIFEANWCPAFIKRRIIGFLLLGSLIHSGSALFWPSWVPSLFGSVLLTGLWIGAVVAMLGYPREWLIFTSILRTGASMNLEVGDELLELQMLKLVTSTTTRGNADEICTAINKWCWAGNMMVSMGGHKSNILEDLLNEMTPLTVLELGTYVGYATLQVARYPSVLKVHTCDPNPLYIAVAGALMHHAGLDDTVNLYCMKGADLIEHLHAKGVKVDLLILDHYKDLYVPDFERALAKVLHRNSVVVADNVRFPGAPMYQQHMAELERKKMVKNRSLPTYVEWTSSIEDEILVSNLLSSSFG